MGMDSSYLQIGNKAHNLLRLGRKYNIPKFHSISVEQIKLILRQNGIKNEELLYAYNGSDKDRLNLCKRIELGKIDLNLDFLESLNRQIIIRSSAVGEDGLKFSFAGIYESARCKNDKSVVKKKILLLISQAISERVYSYCKNIGLRKFPDFSLFIQDYINPEFGGVAFTNTIQNGKKGILLNIVEGSIEKAVKGQKVSLLFIDEKDNFKQNKKYPKKVILKIIHTLRSIEQEFKSPQDVEFCFSDNKIYILQSRKITRNIDEDIKIYDNSNIAESYSGIVLPLTCSFVKILYSRVYRDVARTSNIDPVKIQENEETFDNLISFVNGRIYYDILNWYKMLTLFPGYDRNKRNLDDMISIRSKAELNNSFHRNVHFTDKLRYYPFILYRIARFEHDLRIFKKHVKNYLSTANKIALENKSIIELLEHFEEFKKQLLYRWSITVDNDFLAMTWFGLYKKQCLKLKLENSEIISHISSMNSVISADQVKCIIHLSNQFNKNKTLVSMAIKEEWQKCYSEFMKNQKTREDVENYLETYGGRFANELKLESQDLESDPAHLMQLLYSYKNVSLTGKQKENINSQQVRFTTLKFLASKTKHYLKNREELRLLRSKAFSHARKIFVNIGKKLEKEGSIGISEDIFYLKLEEIQSASKKHNMNLKRIIFERKKEYEAYSKISMPNIILMKNSEICNNELEQITQTTTIIQGIGCSSGMVCGKITVLEKFDIPKQPLEIVVVKNTDPGWTPLFGLCKGLIVENGGLLSHAAIISRELNLPCIIGVKDATKIFKTGQSIKMNGNSGVIRIGK
jgi:rifampicin phosphotransferase